MTNFTNDDLYQMTLDRLRKDRKGAISVEEWESFLRYRNLEYYNMLIDKESEDKKNEASLRPFFYPYRPFTIAQDPQTTLYYADVSGATDMNHIINLWHTTAVVNPARPDLTGLIEVDVVSQTELADRLGNAITGPSSTYPVGYRVYDSASATDRIYVHGISSTTGTIVVSYYKQPADPYYDYYTDASGNITYLTEGLAPYTLQAGEISRSGLTAGNAVTSASIDLDWGDDDAINILDMVVSDVSIALSDPNSFQASLLERKENK